MDNQLETLRHSVSQMQQELEARLDAQSVRSEALYSRLEALIMANRTIVQNTPRRQPGETDVVGGHPYVPKPKLEPPKCDGSVPLRWLYKVKEYFDFYATPPDERLRCVALMLEGSAADWFRWRMTNRMISDWDDFVAKFKLRFDPLLFVDYFGQLAKLRQRGSVMEYQEEFEKLLQHITGASEDILISVFHAGLKHHLQQELSMLKPTTLSESFTMARELEAKHSALLQSVHSRPYSTGAGGTKGPVQGLRAATTAPLLPTPTTTPQLAEPYSGREISQGC
ncbi:unnamed protein product [Cuscuta campestris]|uniref:Retrotransposon gag domain-containing protein n=1 Tax=Cuscuta campestris TaxID=132261 RepID=A0A484L794_9ASTE|nr:unnamed protein product [Cuscuta campestris]